jgi:predicted RNA-binding Zn-ribbon protein involved in translation (DUF1610 family)
LGLLRRLFGGAEKEEPVVETVDLAPTQPEPVEAPLEAAEPLPTCPSCGYGLDPPPERNRRCPSCREPIIVRRADGRTVYLVESAVPIFDRERQRITDLETWADQRKRWLGLAEAVHAPAVTRGRLAAAELSAEVVGASRSLYLSTVESRIRAARRGKRWPEVARLRRQQAMTLFAEAASPVPAPDDIVGLQRDGMLAELRSLQADFVVAELVSVGCCRACRADDGKVFKIATELREPRLPHADCPKGLCGCEWWLAMPVPKKRRRRARPRVIADTPGRAASVDTATIDNDPPVEG